MRIQKKQTEKSTILQELEVLEKFLADSSEKEIKEAAHTIFEKVKTNAEIMSNDEQIYAQRYIAVMDKINEYLGVSKKLENSDNEKIKIFVCYYQPWELPKEDFFVPIQAGKAISPFSLNMQGDDVGDNISNKNATFSEFTAWYWVWKNAKKHYPNLEYIGLSHYRRYFAMNKRFKFEQHSQFVLPKIPEMRNYSNLFIETLENADIILQKPAYFGCSVKEQYSYWHNESDLLCMKEIIREMCPDYNKAFTEVFDNNNGISLCCMFVAKYEILDKYFSWLFPLLFEAERRIDASNYNDHEKRVLAFLAERLLNVYVLYHNLKCAYAPIYFITGKG